ncbi:MAG: iron-sulfur cluster assembly protein [Nanoarchaeota archaeon]|nr:iron-sulfur cluster assembly protein [Nanoarchaeota archaeon]
MPVPKEVMDVLKKIEDPHIGKNIVEAKIAKNIKVVGKKVTLTLVPPEAGCAGCGVIHGMIDEITTELDKKGYTVEIEVGF